MQCKGMKIMFDARRDSRHAMRHLAASEWRISRSDIQYACRGRCRKAKGGRPKEMRVKAVAVDAGDRMGEPQV